MGVPMTDACLACTEHDYASPANQHHAFKTNTQSSRQPSTPATVYFCGFRQLLQRLAAPPVRGVLTRVQSKYLTDQTRMHLPKCPRGHWRPQ